MICLLPIKRGKRLQKTSRKIGVKLPLEWKSSWLVFFAGERNLKTSNDEARWSFLLGNFLMKLEELRIHCILVNVLRQKVSNLRGPFLSKQLSLLSFFSSTKNLVVIDPHDHCSLLFFFFFFPVYVLADFSMALLGMFDAFIRI